MANVVASLTAKFERGLMPEIRKIMSEEAKTFHGLVSSKAPSGFWAYDYNSKKSENEHSYANWDWKLEREPNKIKVKIWNDTHLHNYYNYVAKIANNDLSEQTSSQEFQAYRERMKSNIRDRIKHLKGIK